jgi:hypothetical protein
MMHMQENKISETTDEKETSSIVYNVNGEKVICQYDTKEKGLEEIYMNYIIDKMKSEIDKLFD